MVWKTAAVALAGGLAASVGAIAQAQDEDTSRVLPIDGAPGLMLYVAPEYLPDGKPVDQIYLINRSKQHYCVRLEIAQQKFVHADRKVAVLASGPGVTIRANQVKFLMPRSSYLPKYKALPRPDGETWSWCKKAFKAADAKPPVTPPEAPTTRP